jgi:hypothetical protein
MIKVAPAFVGRAAAAPERNRGGILAALYLVSYLSMGALALVLGAIATARGA